MKFFVCSSFSSINNKNLETVYLVKDNWNDWYTYYTMFSLEYIDNKGNRHSIGSVKIGQVGMNDEKNSPDIPREFNELDRSFFSIGQSSTYYKKLNSINPMIGSKILNALNDIVLKKDSFEIAMNEDITRLSLLRDISINMVKEQFRRIAEGGAELTDYNFNYTSPQLENSEFNPYNLSFEVRINSFPPTNIHVIIGRNGVGKTHLIRNMIRCIINPNDSNKTYGSFNNTDTNFANLVFVSFSAFDEVIRIIEDIDITTSDIPFTYVGLSDYVKSNQDNSIVQKSPDTLKDEFVTSLKKCLFGLKCKLWVDSVTTLQSDPVFKASDIMTLSDQAEEFKSHLKGYSDAERKILIRKFEENAANIFSRLSSGHKIIILTITKLIETVEEKTLVFLDEPEGHLHPPLLSAFIRSLSNLMIKRNGVAIIATHSPVILQEVPKSCVWKLTRNNAYTKAERLKRESFGENIGVLTSEVFGLEVTNSGFHTLLDIAVKEYDTYEDILEQFNYELGIEARSILRGLIAVRDEEK